MPPRIDSTSFGHFDVKGALACGKKEAAKLFTRRDQEEKKEGARKIKAKEQAKKMKEWAAEIVLDLRTISTKMNAYDSRLQFTVEYSAEPGQIDANCPVLGDIKILIHPNRIDIICVPIQELLSDLRDPKYPNRNAIMKGLGKAISFQALDPDTTLNCVVAYLQDHWLPQRAALDAFNQRVQS